MYAVVTQAEAEDEAFDLKSVDPTWPHTTMFVRETGMAIQGRVQSAFRGGDGTPDLSEKMKHLIKTGKSFTVMSTWPPETFRQPTYTEFSLKTIGNRQYVCSTSL